MTKNVVLVISGLMILSQTALAMQDELHFASPQGQNLFTQFKDLITAPETNTYGGNSGYNEKLTTLCKHIDAPLNMTITAFEQYNPQQQQTIAKMQEALNNLEQEVGSWAATQDDGGPHHDSSYSYPEVGPAAGTLLSRLHEFNKATLALDLAALSPKVRSLFKR